MVGEGGGKSMNGKESSRAWVMGMQRSAESPRMSKDGRRSEEQGENETKAIGVNVAACKKKKEK